METSQGLGVTIGLQTDGTLDLLFQQLQGLCKSPVGEKDQTRCYELLLVGGTITCEIVLEKWLMIYLTYMRCFGAGASAISNPLGSVVCNVPILLYKY